MLSYKEKIEAKELTQLSTELAIKWLKENCPSKKPNPFSDNNRKLKDVVNFCYFKRNSSKLMLALSRYGTHLKTLKKLYKSGNSFIKLAALTNVFIGPSGFLEEGVLSEDDALEIINGYPATGQMIDALFGNPHINRDFLERVVSKDDQYNNLKDDVLLHIIWATSGNQILSEKYDDTYLDGGAEYRFNKLPFALLNLLSSVPVNYAWAAALCKLIQKTQIPYVPDELQPELLEKWQIEGRENDTHDPQLSSSFWLRVEIAKVLFSSHNDKIKQVITPDHPDKAVRFAYYQDAEPYDMFGEAVLNKGFEYPSIKFLGDNKLNKTEQSIVGKYKKYFSIDGNDFIEHLITNKNFWKKQGERDFLHDLAWNLAKDKSHHMDVPNNLRAQEQRLLRERPQFFKDDENVDISGDQSLEIKIDQINDAIKSFKEHLEAVLKIVSVKQIGSLWKWSVLILLILLLLKE
jgi:hypothetical protein